jgi:amidase
MNDLVQFSATKLVTKMHVGEIGAVELMNAQARLIEASNSDINALVTLCLERALDEAKLMDQRATKNESMGALHGLPYAVKDTPQTRDVRTTYGSLLFENHVPQQEALPVERALVDHDF